MDINVTGILERIDVLNREISDKKKELALLRQKLPRQAVEDYILLGDGGSKVRLSELFGEHDELIVVHNMGRECAYCTLWADGLNGILKHLNNRAAFVLISPDDPGAQKKFAASRGWEFTMVSSRESLFCADLGFELPGGKQLPGVSTFYRDKDGCIFRVAWAEFGPGDDFCAAWHLLDLLPGGSDHWRPSFGH